MLGDLLRDHRAAWAAAILGEAAVDLAAAEDPVAALREAAAAYWLDGYDPAARSALVEAAGRGAALVLAVPAEGSRDLAGALGATVVPQSLAAGSLIGGAGTAQLNGGGRPAWHLLCTNVAEEALEAGAKLSTAAGPDLAAHVARLEEALATLQEANVRLAREHLGRHDAAAGTIVGRLAARADQAEAQAAEWERRFKFEQELAFKHHEWFMNAQRKLQEPHHRAAERVAKVARPAVSLARRFKRS